MNKPQNPKLFDLIYPLVIEGIEKVVAANKKRNFYKPTYFQYPNMRYWPNGMPNISKSTYNTGPPVKYESYFERYSKEKSPEVVLEELTGYKEVFSYLRENENYKMVYGYPGEEEERTSEIIEININNHIKELVAKALHNWGEEIDLSRENFLEIYLPIENSIYLKELPVAFYIPILFLKFDFDFFEIDDNISIVKLDEKFQLSRININTYSENINEALLSSASHALFIENYSFPNGNKYLKSRMLNDLEAYPLKTINYFFNALRMVIDQPTGYAQVLSKPINWAYGYTADLIELSGVSTRAYPHEFNDFYWLQPEISSISIEELRSMTAIYSGLKEQENKKIQLACKRLESCYLRKDDRDIIIDAVIGLEALLSDSDKGEITHKLSMRIAFLLQMSSLNQSKLEIFKNMKFIYSFRSLIVHGDPKWEKKRKIDLKNSDSILTADLATMYLKECIIIILQNKEYLKANMIDEKMILSD
ncbi:HEPN domain-containing protein [Salinicoccus roseus]|uniref:HEPN domain-containing protein n=1 Tax=Salinicoccus roseus TaxID=45670 RepID=UPI000F4DBBD1|nr:HEPN domain-containing protein [Salinicoccus roseus]RPE54519.1 hypothetical protein EDC33_0775 [Salinicoccus roseus]GGA64901.1 hypothetical protein GCM10007176_06620 [Salinicoccus roseus]